MTVLSTDTTRTYTGDGTSTAFIYDRPFVEGDDIDAVILNTTTNVLRTPTYSRSIGASAVTLTMTDSAPTAEESILLFRRSDLLQDVDYDAGDFPSALHESFADKVILALQEMRDVTDRTIRFNQFTAPIDPIGEIAEGKTLVRTASGFGEGPTADEVTNAQTYSETASAQATIATAKAAEAAGSATAAAASESAADADASAAAASATAAASSEANAASSETNAGTDAAAAAASATAAAASETAADADASAAAASATAAASSEANAASSETNASTDAAAAAASATAAAASAASIDTAKLAGIETGADVTDSANVKSSIEGATLSDQPSPAAGMGLLILDGSELKTVDPDNLSGGIFNPNGSPQDVTGSRSLGTTYQNTTGFAILVDLIITRTNTVNRDFQISEDNIAFTSVIDNNSALGDFSFSVIIPDGYYYKWSSAGGTTLQHWMEYR